MDSNRDYKEHEDFFNIFMETTSTKVIIWKTPNYFIMRRTGHPFDSPTFDFQLATWCLRIYPRTHPGIGNDEYMGFMIARLETYVSFHKFDVILKEGRFEEKFLELSFDNEHKENGDMEFVLRLMKVRSLKIEDRLTLICHISSCRSPAVDAFVKTEILMQDRKDTATGTLCQNFKNLLLNGQDHDVVLKVKDKEFRAHQNILRARSPVFDSMLNHDMIEKNSGVIDIPECDPGAFEQFLLYLYCAKVETLDKDNMLPLYYVADKYDVGDLKEDCREFIKKSLSTSNITDVVEIALNHSDADLLQCATEYFVKEVNEVLPTVEWQSFMKRNTTQANELIIKAVKKLSGGKT